MDDNFFPLFVDGAGSVPAWWDDGFAVSRVAMSLYQMIYADVRARLGDSVNTGVSGVNNTFFPLAVDGDNNIPLFWDNGFNVSMISEGFQQKVWAYINAIIANALNQHVPLISPGFVPGMMDDADNVPFWFHVWGGDRLCMDGSSPRKQREALRDKAWGRTSRICTAGRKMRFFYDLCDEFCTILDC